VEYDISRALSSLFNPDLYIVKGSNLFLNGSLIQWLSTLFVMGHLCERKASLNAGVLAYAAEGDVPACVSPGVLRVLEERCGCLVLHVLSDGERGT